MTYWLIVVLFVGRPPAIQYEPKLPTLAACYEFAKKHFDPRKLGDKVVARCARVERDGTVAWADE